MWFRDGVLRRAEVAVAEPVQAAAWLVALVTLTVVIPTNQLLGENPFFLLAHEASAWAVIGLWLVALAVLFLFLLGVFTALRRWLPPVAYRVIVAVAIGVASIVLLAGALAKFSPTPVITAVVVVGLALGFVAIIHRHAMGVATMVIAILVSVVPLAVAESPQSQITGSRLVSFTEGAPAPVLIAVADELQYPVVMDASGSVRPEFPNLKRLQLMSTTYTRAYAPANATDASFPTMLNGLTDAEAWLGLPDQQRQHSGLLTWLSSTYEVATNSEYFGRDVTQRSEGGARSGTRAIVRQRQDDVVHSTALLAADLVAVAGRTTLHPELASALPRIDDRWIDYWSIRTQTHENADGHRIVDTLAGGDATPGLALWHSMTTHVPYVRDYAGQTFNSVNVDGAPEGEHSSALKELQRRLYVAAAMEFDRQLGWFMSELEARGTLDRMMIVLTADHGRAFPARSTWRVGDTEAERWSEVAHVPLIVKDPYQRTPRFESSTRSITQIPATVLQTAGITLTGGPAIEPPLSSQPTVRPTFWFDRGDGTAGMETLPDDEPADPWSADWYRPVSDASPFAVGIDPTLIGKPVPKGAGRVATVANEQPAGDSPLHAIVARKPADACMSTSGADLVVADGIVVGSIAWQGPNAPGEGERTGWGVVPRVAASEYEVWCLGARA